MNTIKTAIIASIISLASVPVFAQPLYNGGNYISRVDSKTVSVALATTSDEAYQLGLSELHRLKTMSAQELNNEFRILTFNTYSKSTHLENLGFVTVQERMNVNGELEYVGKVNIKVHYMVRDSNR
ncbi:DUF3316 domain-containing protein [Vibrio parahaemolyticus]|uniref:DUF3316 domain-containing protein n=1 Tax=Vibrio TaxID=662 RepID=UPI000A3AD9DF|nr:MULTISPECIES: DUF3316 domain-containing protein [Vibrio harveyi group]EJG0322458.1 DUF3316 domain-containing protein [Vibrio parahaemolyticus]MBE3869921.1 DUF3316 domain-containing protein [Vibrio parahaemolyticus]MBS9857739.1 DUF3316 domain-containing protein [Vibrio alginolyticus]MCS0083712.1 DUF3316 domain-containing protein [Vibrio alginolyticus]TOA38140.1 DUF3316 domain-containing protein [Vibrio parahaemolyticus]